jgi:7-cyano-7-deazaguanine synthase
MVPYLHFNLILSQMNIKDKSKALVLLSGGQDSTTCLFWALSEFDEIEAIGFHYGQRHRKELEIAASIAENASVLYRVIRIDTLAEVSDNALTNTDIEVDTEVKDGQTPNTLVEGRNLLFLTYAAIYAKSKGIHNLVIGAGQTDYSGYPDCRDEFMKSAKQSLTLALDYNIEIHTPLMWKNKKETWALADKLGVLELIEHETLTCYNGIQGRGCGQCPACILRNKGLTEYKASR